MMMMMIVCCSLLQLSYILREVLHLLAAYSLLLQLPNTATTDNELVAGAIHYS